MEKGENTHETQTNTKHISDRQEVTKNGISETRSTVAIAVADNDLSRQTTDLLVGLKELVLALLVLLCEGQEALIIEQRLVGSELEQLRVRGLVGYGGVVAGRERKENEGGKKISSSNKEHRNP